MSQNEEIDKISEESSFAHRLLDLIKPLKKFRDGETMARYVFVLGDPFNNNVLVKGFIDTLLCNPKRLSYPYACEKQGLEIASQMKHYDEFISCKRCSIKLCSMILSQEN